MIIFPRDAQIAQIDLAFAAKSLASDQSFTRYFAKYQRWIPVALHDSVLIRAEAGQLFSSAQSGIPEEYLFRTGGSSSVRGYAYQSLGVADSNSAVAGGRVTATASIEYDHWFDSSIGVAVFSDFGDAATSWKDYKIKQSIGSGLRYMTPAGPIALDLAYARQKKSVRLEFSIAIAF